MATGEEEEGGGADFLLIFGALGGGDGEELDGFLVAFLAVLGGVVGVGAEAEGGVAGVGSGAGDAEGSAVGVEGEFDAGGAFGGWELGSDAVVGFAGVVVGDGAVFTVREVADVDVEFLEGEVVEFVAVVGFCEFEASFVAEAALGVDGEVFAVLFGGEPVVAALEDVFGVLEEIGFRV